MCTSKWNTNLIWFCESNYKCAKEAIQAPHILSYPTSIDKGENMVKYTQKVEQATKYRGL
jgi:hypothetical protein